MNEEKCFVLYKNLGETPLEALERVRISRGLNPSLPMTYAGRLDPMAEGVLLILVGEECKKKDNYLGMDKEYEVEVLFGFESDTYDILGKVKSQEGKVKSENNNLKVLDEEIQKFKGEFAQKYPIYSSKTVNGVQLHTLANRGELPDEIPTKKVEIYDIQILGEREIDSQTLFQEIKERIGKVKGDFRQKEITDIWSNTLQGLDPLAFFRIVKLKVSCSSGTYMRSLAHNLGQELKVPSLAYSIKRTKVGEFAC